MTKQEFDPRRAEPGQRFTYHDAWNERVEFSADDEGVVRPKNEAQQAAADALGLPIAQKVKAEEQKGPD